MVLRTIEGLVRTGRLLPAALVALVVAGAFGATVVSAFDGPAECAVADDTLASAKALYADSCALPRVDCDRIDGVWYCSSRVIGDRAPGGVTADDVGSSDIGTGGTLVVTTMSTVPASTTIAPTSTTGGPTSTVTDTSSTVVPTSQPPTTEGPTTTAQARRPGRPRPLRTTGVVGWWSSRPRTSP